MARVKLIAAYVLNVLLVFQLATPVPAAAVVQAGMFTVFLDAVKAAVAWFLDLVAGFGQLAIGWALSLLPDPTAHINSTGSSIRTALGAANAWAPLDTGVSLFAVYIVVLFSWLLHKIALKLIP